MIGRTVTRLIDVPQLQPVSAALVVVAEYSPANHTSVGFAGSGAAPE
jgi:hypothetical protein